MSSITPNARPDFFGKDKFTPFIGVIEDVNDPKQSGRCKVRCIGWHPKQKKGGDESGEDGLTTDDLPWAKVGMPTTHAQQSRIGGKHGLLPGCWVMGFFLDGEEAQDPFILTSFNFTANASEEDYRQIPEGTDGKFSDADQAFDKNEVGGENQPNIDTRQYNEQSGRGYKAPTDPSGDVVNDDSDSPENGQKSRQSAASYRRQVDPMKVGEQGNAEGQKYEVAIGDGLCGTIAHAREDMQRRLVERMPSQFSRINFGDQVWNRFTGSFMSVNGIMAQLALEFSGAMKSPANSLKAFTERTLNRPKKQTEILKKPDRDGVDRQDTDDKTTKKDDEFHAIYQENMIDTMFDTVFGILKAADSAGGSGGGGGGGGGGGNSGGAGSTNISNFEALCLADGVATTVEDVCHVEIAKALAGAAGASEGSEGFEFLEDVNTIAGIIGSLVDVMQFPLLQKSAAVKKVFNHSGSRSQDYLTKEQGCRPMRVYNTELGSLASLAGFGGDSGGTRASNRNDQSPGNKDWSTVDFCGHPVGGTRYNIVSANCGGTLEILVPDPGVPVDVDNSIMAHRPNGPVILNVSDAEFEQATFPVDWTRIRFMPAGKGAKISAVSLPAADPDSGELFEIGIPNVCVCDLPGGNYWFGNPVDPGSGFPSVYIPGYNGTPVPVIDRPTGEIVAIITNPNSWSDREPFVTVTVVPDSSDVGILTDDPDFDVVIGGFQIVNIGFDYEEDVEVLIIDKDTGEENGKVVPTVLDGHIVDLDIADTGTGFRRIPQVVVKSKNEDKPNGSQPGYGLKVRPIMTVIPRGDAKLPQSIEAVYCPAKNQQNYTDLS